MLCLPQASSFAGRRMGAPSPTFNHTRAVPRIFPVLDKIRRLGSLPYFMTDPRYKALAKLLVGYSTELKKGDRFLLDMIDSPDAFSVELMRAARAPVATPIIEV